MSADILFQPLQFRNLTVKNRVFRSNISGQFDNYDGSGGPTRLNWEEKFARGGVGAIVSSFVPVAVRGRILPHYAMIHSDASIPFWCEVGKRVHAYDCRYILQLSHSGRQQDIGGVENMFHQPLSSTSQVEAFNGFTPRAMTREEIHATVQAFAQGARRAREAGLDGVELHGANGYLITQFLSSSINDRQDEYGGPVENRARFVREIVRAIRREVGRDFHLQMKINGLDYGNWVIPSERRGNTIEETVKICQWLEQDGVDAFHVSAGNTFPHPLNPPGTFPIEWAARTYDVMASGGVYAFSRYLLMGYRLLRPLFNFYWNRRQAKRIEGINVDEAREVKRHVAVPVICTGGFQTASYARQVIGDGFCDAVSIARSLIANNDLVKIWESGQDRPDRPCTYCNKCLVNVLKNPLGCYEVSRFDGDHDAMMAELMSVYHPTPYETALGQ